MAWFLAAFAATTFASVSVFADVTTTYSAASCKANEFVDAGLLQTEPGKVRNVSSGDLDVHCPIIKKTSGPGVTNDAIKSTSFAVETNDSLKCSITVRKSKIVGWQTSNTRYATTKTVSSSKTLTYGEIPVNRFWDAEGTSSSSDASWYYADLTCKLPPNATLGNYTVTEAGVDRDPYRIYPSASCRSHYTNDIPWQFLTPSSGNPLGGIIMGQASNDLKPFSMVCPIPNNSMATVEVGPAVSGNTMKCQVQRYGQLYSGDLTWSWTYWGQSEWPSGKLPRPFNYQAVMSIPTNGVHELRCGVDTDLGDGKLVSYRSRPNPDRSSWVVTASVGNGSAGNAVDDDPGTRWTTGRSAQAGDWIQVDLGTYRILQSITMDSWGSNGDYARKFDIEVSYNGSSWNKFVENATGSSVFIRRAFSEMYTRYVRIKLREGFSNWWSIHELNLYEAADGG